MSTLAEIQAALIELDIPQLQAKVRQALDEGLAAGEVLDGGLIAGMNEIGVRFKNNEMFMPEVLVAARAMHAALDILKPELAAGESRDRGAVVIGTIKGDLHDIGKNLVAMMLEGGGFRVIDLGVDAPPEKFAAAIEAHRPQVVGLSALLTSTMPQLKATIDHLARYRERVAIVVGGAPVTQGFADEIGADGYAPDAAQAVDLVRAIMAAKP